MLAIISAEFFVFEFTIKNVKIKIYRTINLLVVLCGCKTWSLILREEHKMRLFESMLLRKIFGLHRYDVTGGWKRLHKEELYDLYSSPNIPRTIISRKIKLAVNVAIRDRSHFLFFLSRAKVQHSVGGFSRLRHGFHSMWDPCEDSIQQIRKHRQRLTRRVGWLFYCP
jgi:hypothetical protein